MNQLEPSEIVFENNLRSPLQIIIDDAVTRAKNVITPTTDEEKKAHKNLLAFITKEKARITNMAKLETQLDNYRDKINKKTDLTEKLSESGNSDKLGNFLSVNGEHRANEHFHAHHIICAKHASHAGNRYILLALDMKYGINDPENGCWLPTRHKYAVGTHTPRAAGHYFVHTDKYANWVGNQLGNPTSREVLSAKLMSMKNQLLSFKESTAIKFMTKDGITDLKTST